MSKEHPPSRTADQFVVRFPDGMRDRIAEAARQNNRSMNAEIVSRLLSTFEVDPAFKSAMQQQQDQLAQLYERRNTLVLLLGAVDAKSAPTDEVQMLKRRLAEIKLSIENTERRIKQFSKEQPPHLGQE